MESALTDKQEKALIEIEKCHGLVISCHSITPVLCIYVCSKVDEFQNYSDMDSMLQYCKDVQTVQRRLGEIQEQVNQINKVSHSCGSFSACINLLAM